MLNQRGWLLKVFVINGDNDGEMICNSGGFHWEPFAISPCGSYVYCKRLI